MSLEALIDTLVSDAQLATGADLDVIGTRVGFARSAPRQTGGRPARWTRAEDDFLRENLTRLGIAECARILGRAENAVKIRFTRKQIPAPSKGAGWLTAHQAARLLGIDAHKTAGWIDAGIMPGHLAPWSERGIRLVSITQLKMWLIRPETWIYIDVAKIQHPSLRRLVQLAQARWGDEWLSMKAVAALLGCDHKNVYQHILRGNLRAIQARHLGGRDEMQWAFWFVRRSDAERVVIRLGKGNGFRPDREWPAAADAFMLRMHAEGKSYADIGRMMKWSEKRVGYRVRVLKAGTK